VCSPHHPEASLPIEFKGELFAILGDCTPTPEARPERGRNRGWVQLWRQNKLKLVAEASVFLAAMMDGGPIAAVQLSEIVESVSPNAAFIRMLSVASPGDWIPEIKKTAIDKAVQDSRMRFASLPELVGKCVVIRRIAASQRRAVVFL
jgi:hypothetical protein